jgi:Tol biopolymer transport system component
VTWTIYVGNTDGSGKPTIIAGPQSVNPNEGPPRWSPDGSWIVFGTAGNGIAGPDLGLSLVHPDGSGLRRIPITPANLNHYAYSPNWSPDGTHIIFSLWFQGGFGTDLYTIRPDGSERTQVTRADGTEDFVSWAPAP